MTRATALVWTTWAVLTAVLLACIARFTANVPIAEDWMMVPAATGSQHGFWTWLWSQNNEHRLPVPRLILLGLLRLFHDFRAGMVFDTLLTAAIAAMLLVVVARIRGGTRYTDVFIPLVLLHLGNWENLLWAWQLCFVVSLAFAALLLVAVVDDSFLRTRWRAVVAALSLAALPLCGANGLVFALPIALWFLIEAAGTREWSIVAVGAVAAIAETVVYFIGYQRASWYPPSPGLRYTIGTMLRVIALGLGPAASWSWRLIVPATILVLAPVAVVVVRTLVRSGGRSRRPWRLAAYFAGATALALAVGWGRAGLMPTVGLPSRYVFLTLPIWIAAYVAVELFAAAPTRRVVQVAMVILACVLLPLNVRAGLQWRDWYDEGVAATERDIAAGIPVEEIARRHERFLYRWNRRDLVDRMEMLRAAGMGPFVGLTAPPSAGRN